jgi:crotonobetainyl-CoA:carnitine CoA-transferase CaiB-like acyl-CoA transferase
MLDVVVLPCVPVTAMVGRSRVSSPSRSARCSSRWPRSRAAARSGFSDGIALDTTTSAPSGTFRTADGLLNIAANQQAQWEALCRHLGREDLLDDPRYRTREDRKAHRHELRAELERTLAGRSARDWADELNRLGVPAGEVLSVPDILDHPQVAGRGMIAAFDDVPGAGRAIRVLRTGVKIDGEAPAVDAPPPRLGEHNTEVYGALGLSADEIAGLKAEGVL